MVAQVTKETTVVKERTATGTGHGEDGAEESGGGEVK